MHQRQNLHALTMGALGAALVCVSTRIFQIPIPLGYAHLGNAVIFLFGVYCDPWVGAGAAGVGSALADLLSFPQWAVPTLLIKTLMGYVVSAAAKPKGGRGTARTRRCALGVLAGAGIMIAGYTVAGAILYGSAAAGLAQLPGLVAEGAVGIGLFYVLALPLERTGVLKAPPAK